MPNPRENPELYDRAVVAGSVSPPIDEDGVEGFGIAYKVDTKEPDGSSGGVSTYKGQKVGEGSIRFAMYDADDFADWDAIFPLLKLKRDAKEAIEIYHQDILDQGFKDFIVEEIGARQGGWAGSKSTRTVKLKAFAPPTPARGTPTKAKTATGANGAEAAKPVADALDKEIEDLTKKFEEA